MPRQNLPAKFKMEKTCPICKCTYIPKKAEQNICSGCKPVPQPIDTTRPSVPKDSIRDLVLGILEELGLGKKCVTCGELFIPKSPASKFCKKCKDTPAIKETE